MSLDIPGWNLRFVGNEEVVQMPSYEGRTGVLLEDDVYDVLAIEISSMSEEGLFRVVMVLLTILESPGEAPVG